MQNNSIQKTVERIDEGSSNRSYRILGPDNFVLQFGGNPAATELGVQIVDLLDEYEVNTPDIVHFDVESGVKIAEELDGKHLEERPTPENAREAGRELAKAHDALEFGAYGPLAPSDSGPVIIDRYSDWIEFQDFIYEGSLERAESKLGGDLVDRLDCFYENHREQGRMDSWGSIIHFDVTEGNILVGDQTTIIDWDNAVAGDSYFDFVKSIRNLERRGLPYESFSEGYWAAREGDRPENKDQLYGILSELVYISSLKCGPQKQPTARRIDYSQEKIESLLEGKNGWF